MVRIKGTKVMEYFLRLLSEHTVHGRLRTRQCQYTSYNSIDDPLWVSRRVMAKCHATGVEAQGVP